MSEPLQFDDGSAFLNAVDQNTAEVLLERCCGSKRWVHAMLVARPFADGAHLEEEAERAFDALDETDWLEAFAAHPRIGEHKVSAADERESTEGATRAAMAAAEQASTAAASEDTLAALAEGNALYEERFGFVYLVFATGKTSEEMLALLERRLQNTRSREVLNAAREQRLITALRLSRIGTIEG